MNLPDLYDDIYACIRGKLRDPHVLGNRYIICYFMGMFHVNDHGEVLFYNTRSSCCGRHDPVTPNSRYLEQLSDGLVKIKGLPYIVQVILAPRLDTFMLVMLTSQNSIIIVDNDDGKILDDIKIKSILEADEQHATLYTIDDNDNLRSFDVCQYEFSNVLVENVKFMDTLDHDSAIVITYDNDIKIHTFYSKNNTWIKESKLDSDIISISGNAILTDDNKIYILKRNVMDYKIVLLKKLNYQAKSIGHEVTGYNMCDIFIIDNDEYLRYYRIHGITILDEKKSQYNFFKRFIKLGFLGIEIEDGRICVKSKYKLANTKIPFRLMNTNKYQRIKSATF